MQEIPDGFQTDPGHDPAEDHIGPFYFKVPVAGQSAGYECAFVADQHHCNVTDIVHGGVLMSFADFAACIEATDNYREEDCVTITFSSEFIAAGEIGSLIQSRVKVIRKTGSIVFVTGEIFSSASVLLTFSSVIKRLRRDAA